MLVKVADGLLDNLIVLRQLNDLDALVSYRSYQISNFILNVNFLFNNGYLLTCYIHRDLKQVQEVAEGHHQNAFSSLQKQLNLELDQGVEQESGLVFDGHLEGLVVWNSVDPFVRDCIDTSMVDCDLPTYSNGMA